MANDLRERAYAATAASEEAQGRSFEAGESTHEAAATLTAALLSRLDLPDDRDQAAELAVSLFWRVKRSLASESPEQARPERSEPRVQIKQQP